ncbi:protein of unknown function [Candidatus Nitrosacidococcus tergens]|uniref:Uncharacterized protein n=1 Tax=Candidatus Nitrosacidococcus tergens TaxID=553981 RepID=A0A7G1Q975_9GAMM|nr:protein of unknown function [Candidatus Nitrosacidococcus tergens]
MMVSSIMVESAHCEDSNLAQELVQIVELMKITFYKAKIVYNFKAAI